MTTFERLRHLIEEETGHDVRAEDGPETVGLDSLETAELLDAISDEFRVDLPFTEIAYMSSFGSWAKIIDAKIEDAQGRP